MAPKSVVVSLILALVTRKEVSAVGVVQIYVNQCDNCNSSSFELVPVGGSSDASVVKLGVPSDSYFFIIQVHHHLHAMRLSHDADPNVQNGVIGSNIGLNQINTNKEIHIFYLFYNFTTSNDVLFAVTSYSETAPMPGGCTMELNTLSAPNEEIFYNDALITVDVQKPSIKNHPCDIQANVTLDFYLLHAKYSINQYQDILNMLTPDSITMHGFKVIQPSGCPDLRRYFGNYQGFPVVYAVIATYGNESASYVPALTYGCDMIKGTKSCFDLNYNGNWTIMSIVCFVSLVLLLIPRITNTIPLFNIYFYGITTFYALCGLQSFYYTFSTFLCAIGLIVTLEWFYKFTECTKYCKILLRFYAASIWLALLYSAGAIGTVQFMQSPLFFWLLYIMICCVMMCPCFDRYAQNSAVAFNITIAALMILGYDEILFVNINTIRRITISNFYMASLYMFTVSYAGTFFALLFCVIDFGWYPLKSLFLWGFAKIFGVDVLPTENNDVLPTENNDTDDRTNEETPLIA